MVRIAKKAESLAKWIEANVLLSAGVMAEPRASSA